MTKEQVRALAGAAWLSGGRKMKEALPIFKESVQQAGLPLPKAPEKAIRKWGKQMEEKGHVRAAHHKAGRKSKLSSDQVATLVHELLGWRKAGMTAPYASIHRFCVDNPTAKKIKAKTGVCTETIRRQLHAQLPRLSRVLLKVKAKLTEAHKSARVNACKRLLRVPLKELEWVVWVDAKTLYVNLNHRYGWIDKASATPEDHVLQHHLAGKSSRSTCQVKYYAAVNAKVGTIGLYFITGTTGMPANRDGLNYKVSLLNHKLQPL